MAKKAAVVTFLFSFGIISYASAERLCNCPPGQVGYWENGSCQCITSPIVNYVNRAGDKIDLGLSNVPVELLSPIFGSVPAKSTITVTQPDADVNASVADRKFNVDLKGLPDDKASEILSKLGNPSVKLPEK